jgi:RNA polymerase sigma-70 factor, ECF subfamily
VVGHNEEMDTVAARFRDGDVEALAEIYHRYAGAVTTVARSALWSDDLVADAVQQTFVNAWGARASFDPSRPLAPWLYAIARRVSIDLIRRERRRQGPEPSETGLAVLPVEMSAVWETFEVRAALDALPPDERQVLRLHYFEGLSHSEIADGLDIPLGTVKSRSHRAHARLSELLGHLLDEPKDISGRMGGQA